MSSIEGISREQDKNHILVSQMNKTVTLQIVTFVPQIRLSQRSP